MSGTSWIDAGGGQWTVATLRDIQDNLPDREPDSIVFYREGERRMISLPPDTTVEALDEERLQALFDSAQPFDSPSSEMPDNA